MFVRTERLLLRPGWAEDVAALAGAIGDDAAAGNPASAALASTPAQACEFLLREPGALPSLLIFARTRASPRLVGGISLDRDGGGDVELSYWIGRHFRGVGFATEAGQAMVDLAQRGLRVKRLVSATFRHNPAAGRVLHKLGFRATDAGARHGIGRAGDAPSLLFVRDDNDAGTGQRREALAA